MTNRNQRNCRYLIEANGRDCDGTCFQYFDGAQGWGAAAQAMSEMSRCVPGSAEIKVYECDFEAGSSRDVTEEMRADEDLAYHRAAQHWTDKTKVRRTPSTYVRSA